MVEIENITGVILKTKDIFPWWLKTNREWDLLLENRDRPDLISHFLDFQYLKDGTDKEKVVWKIASNLENHLIKQISGNKSIDQTDTIYSIREIGNVVPQLAAKFSEIQAMIYLLITEQWVASFIYIIEAERFYRKSGDLDNYDDLKHIRCWVNCKICFLKTWSQKANIEKYFWGLFLYLFGLTSLWGNSLLRFSLSTCSFVLLFSVINYIIGTTCEFSYSKKLDEINSLYYTVISMTTLGYGDIYPNSPITKILSMIQVVTGALVFGNLITIFGNNISQNKF